jgi:hypothetical protein
MNLLSPDKNTDKITSSKQEYVRCLSCSKYITINLNMMRNKKYIPENNINELSV